MGRSCTTRRAAAYQPARLEISPPRSISSSKRQPWTALTSSEPISTPKKCYDSQVREIVFGAAQAMGCPPGLVQAQARFYTGLQRAFRYRRIICPWWGSQTSILQGCALSQIWINLVTTLWCRAVRERALEVRQHGYVDDRTLTTRSIQTLQVAPDATAAFDLATGQRTNAGKTNVWSTSDRPEIRSALSRLRLAGAPLTTVAHDKNLGVQLFYRGKVHPTLLAQRGDKMIEAAERLQRLRIQVRHKERLARYGCGANPPLRRRADSADLGHALGLLQGCRRGDPRHPTPHKGPGDLIHRGPQRSQNGPSPGAYP